MENENRSVLLLDQEVSPIIIEEECRAFQPIIRDFVECYAENKDKPVEEWLSQKMQESLPEKSTEDIQMMTKEIISTIEKNEANKVSLAKAIENGQSKESWFASETQKATSTMSTQKTVQYLDGLDSALQTANESLYRTITTQAGRINKNPRLDGYIAEQYHAQTFNLNAEARGSQYRAKVLEPTGKGYAKNSVDIVIVDENGKTVKRYQSKYCKDAKATEKAFEEGDYRGQQKLVPEEQQGEIQKKSTTVLEAPDGTTSTVLKKSTAEKMKDEAQSGKWNELNWNEYKMKDLALGVGKQAGYAALQGAAISTGFEVAQKLWNGEEIKGKDVVEKAIVSGTDFGVKAATTGAIKVGIEKDIISVIPKGTPASVISNVAFVGIENAKVVGKMMNGDCSFKEGIEKIEQTTVAISAGLATMGKGAAIGATVATIFGPIGAAIGGFVGGSVGYMAGSKIGEKVVKGAQKVRDGAIKVKKTIALGVKNTVSNVASGVKNFCSGLVSFFGF